jgi:hypothetical protein
MSITSTVLPQRLAFLAAALLLAACSGTATTPPAASASPLTGALTNGLIAYVADQGVGVLDPATGKSTIVAPLAPGAFRVAGPVWAGQPKLDHPVLYFTIHDDRPAETRSTAGVQPYDWLFRVDPFLGSIDPIAASQDSSSEGPFGLVANSHYVALTVGCCATYEVDALDLSQTTQSTVELKTLARPPAQPAFFTEGIVPGDSGLVAVRQFGTGSWYWLNADAKVLNPFPIKLGPDDGPIAISPDGTMAAVSMPDHGAVIQPINSALPIESPSATASASASPSASAHPTAATIAPHSVNSKLPHPDGIAWNSDAKQVALAVNGELEIYSSAAPDGTAATNRYLSGANVIGVSWSGPIERQTFANIKPAPGPQALVDGLLAATRLPATADTAANRPFTKVYVWQFDSTRASPISAITDATPDVLASYPPLDAGVVLHHWAASDTWALLGGCFRYRVVVTGSIAPVATTVGLATNVLCSTKAPASPSPSHS